MPSRVIVGVDALGVVRERRGDFIVIKRKYVPLKLRFAVSSKPCAVCRGLYNICADHIIPVAKGGTNDSSNLQPLCWQCNHIKGSKAWSNAEIAAAIRKRGRWDFLQREFWRLKWRFTGSFQEWIEKRAADAPELFGGLL